MHEKFFLAMNENEQLEFIKEYADEHKNMSRDEEFYDLITKEKKDGESEYYYNDYAIFLLSDKVYESILRNIGPDITKLFVFFGYAWDQFENDGKIVATKSVEQKFKDPEFVETKIIDKDKFLRFFSMCLGKLDNFQKAYLQKKMLAWPSLFYMFPADIQNKLNKYLDLNFEVKTDFNKIWSEKIFLSFNKVNYECCYDINSDGQCSVRAANMGYRIFKGGYFKNKNEIKDDMTYDQCVNLRKEAYKLTGENALAKGNYRSWMDPKYILGYFDKRDKENGNGSIPWVRLGWHPELGFGLFISGILEKGIFTSILDGCIVIGSVNKNHAVCLKEDYKSRKKYLIGFCDTLRDMALANFSYVNVIDYSNGNVIERVINYVLSPFWCSGIDRYIMVFSSNREELNKISQKLDFILSAFAADQKYFICVRFLEFMYDEYKKALEEDKWNEMTIEKIINELIPKFKKEIIDIDKDKNMKKVDYGLEEKDFFVDLPDGCETIFAVEKKLFDVRGEYEVCNRESMKNRRRSILSALEPAISVEPNLAQRHFKQREYLRKRVNDYSYFFYTLDETSIKVFLKKNIFPWKKFNIYNDRPDIQILALENMDDGAKKILLAAFEKNNNFFDGCNNDVKKKLVELGIIFDEQKNNQKDSDNKKINEHSLNEFENYLSDLKSNFPDVLKDYEKKLVDIKMPEKFNIDTKDFNDKINKLKNEIDEKVKQAKQKKLDEKKERPKEKNEDKKKNDLKIIKRCALVTASVLGNQKAYEIINKLTDDELDNFYNKNKNMLEKIKAELCKKENLEKLGLKEEDFLSNGFKLDDEKVNDISKKFNITYKDKLWFVGLGTGEVVSVILMVSMFFFELPVLAISSGPLAIGFLVGLIYKLVKQIKINTGQKKFFENIKADKDDFFKVSGQLALANLQKNKTPEK